MKLHNLYTRHQVSLGEEIRENEIGREMKHAWGGRWVNSIKIFVLLCVYMARGNLVICCNTKGWFLRYVTRTVILRTAC